MPLIGAQGPGSNISWRGNLDEYPDFFEFPQIIDAEIGVPITSIAQTITGINYKALVTAVGSGASVSVNGGEFLDGNDENNWIIIRNEDVIQLQIRTQDTDSRFDFNKTYNVDVTVGKRDASWSVISKRLDDTPDDFSFTDSLNNEVNALITSNEVTITGIDEDLGVDILVKSPTGTLFINGTNVGRSAKIKNNDTLYLQNTTSNFYETDVDTIIQLGTFETTWKIRTRVANKTVNAFNLGSVLDVNRNTIQISNTITITGPDPNINGNNPLDASILGANGEFRVVRSGVEIRGYSAEPFTVQTGDQITVKAVASNDFDTTIVASLTISQTVGSFSIETRPTPIKTFPSQFNFVDRTGVERTNTLTPPENRIDSAPITLTGMTTATNDFGTASITGNGGDGSRAQFKVVRNGQTVRDFGIANFQVRNGDEITLRIISSPNSLGSVQAVFTVTGIDTNNVIAGVAGSTSDTWVVTSAQRFCNITTFSLPEETNATPDVSYTRSFVAEGFDKDCRCTVTTSDTANSFLRVGDRTGTSLEVNLGDTVTVSLICPYFDSTRSTTVTLTSSFNTQKSAIFKITPKAPPLPELTIDADPRNPEFIFPVGGSTVLTYTYDFVTNPAVVTNFGVTTVTTPKGSGTVNRTNLTESITYSITVSNSTGSTTKTVQVLVGDPPTPTISLCPSNTSSCPAITNIAAGSPVTLFWRSTFATSVTSPDFNTGNLQSGSITLTPTVDNKIYSISATGPGGTVTATQQINLTPTVTLTVNPDSITNGGSGATLIWNSNLATRVVSTNGFFASGPSGSISVNPTVTTTYSITVADDEGLTATATARLTVEDDRTVDSFFFNPSSFTERETGEVVVSEPFFSVGGSSVSGLSPGVSVTANVSGVGAQFESGGTSKTVQNGTSTNSLRVALTNSFNRNEQRTATLNINGVSASFTSKTKACTVNETTATIDNSITIKLRQAPALNNFIGYAIEGGFGNVPRTAGSSGEQLFTSSGSFTVPSGISRVKIEAIGGGGGGCSGRDCTTRAAGVGGGGGAASTTEIDVLSGEVYGVSVGAGGAGFVLGSSNTGGTTTSTSTEQVDQRGVKITTNGCSVSVSNDPGGYIQNATAQNCGDPNVAGGCSNSKSRRYYSIRIRFLDNPSCTVEGNSSTTAGGLDTSRDGSIFFNGSQRDTNGEFLFWFCRGNGGGGTTHVREFTVRIRGSRSTTTTTTDPGVTNFGGGAGGPTRVTNPSRRVVAAAAGGGGGGWNSTTRVPGTGGSPNGGGATSTGGGGGSGKLSGGTNTAGTSLTGGTGEQFGGSTSSGSGPSGSGCARSGGSGGAYGAGGGGGSGSDGRGGNGASGAVRFSWTAPPAQSFTYAQVVTQIFSAFWSKGSRGPTSGEIQTWVNNFKNSPSTYPDLTSLSNAITVQNLGPTPPVDNCGDAIPRFP